MRQRFLMYISVADGVKEGGVGRRAERAGDVRGKGSVFEVGDGRSSGVDGEGGDECGDLGWVGCGLRWGRRWYVESSHILTSLFGANENGCRVSRRKIESQVGVRRQEPEA